MQYILKLFNTYFNCTILPLLLYNPARLPKIFIFSKKKKKQPKRRLFRFQKPNSMSKFKYYTDIFEIHEWKLNKFLTTLPKKKILNSLKSKQNLQFSQKVFPETTPKELRWLSSAKTSASSEHNIRPRLLFNGSGTIHFSDMSCGCTKEASQPMSSTRPTRKSRRHHWIVDGLGYRRRTRSSSMAIESFDHSRQ